MSKPHFVARSYGRLLASVIVAFSGASVHAAQPLITDDTGTQGAAGNQIELALTGTRNVGNTDKEYGFVFTRGVAESLDVFGEVAQVKPAAGDSGMTNPAIGLKWRFFENDNKTSFAVKPIFIAPVSKEKEEQGLGAGKSSWELSIIATQELSWGAVHANLVTGKTRYRAAGADEKMIGVSVAPMWTLSDAFKLAADVGMQRVTVAGESADGRHGEIGIIYSPNADLDLAVGVIRYMPRDGAGNNEVTGGLTWRFK